ncbi:MAG: methyltransferase domain-containing protein [Chloroflexota bacterium]
MPGRKKFNRFRVEKPTPNILAKYALVYEAEKLYRQPDTYMSLSSANLFDNDHPLVFDLGSGRGEFLLRQAEMAPNKNFVGIDLHWKSIYDSVNKLNEVALPNLKFVRADLRWIFNIVPDLTVETVYLLFPAPVMKKRYRNRDVVTADFLRQVHRILQKGGTFHFVTDSQPFYEKKQQLLADLNLFPTVKQATSYEGGQTRYQQYWEGFDVLSWRADYQKWSAEN